MTVSISQSDEQLLRHAVASGQFNSEAEALREALRLLTEQAENGQPQKNIHADPDGQQIACPQKWIESFNAWVDKSRTGNPNMDDSRESIY